jgi:hypothetical protein
MPLAASGTLSLAGTTTGQSIALELSKSATATISLNDTDVRALAGITTPASTISISNFYGKAAGIDPGGAVNPALVTYAAGLFITARVNYHNENPYYLPTGSTFSGGNYNDINFSVSSGTLVSYLWSGYFFAPATGTYRFQTTSDDGSYVWLGANVNGNASQSIVNNGGNHGSITITSVSYTLTGGFFYPIKILYGNSGGAGVITFRFNVNGGAFTNNGSGYYFYNTLTNGY